jgi:hypothetical protein
MWYSVKPH